MFRLDRFFTIYFFGFLYHSFKKDKGIMIQILMYHSISDEKESGHPYYWINTSPKRFYEQMKFLKEKNYKVISLSDAVKLISESKEQSEPDKLKKQNKSNKPELPDRPDRPKYVVLTFDDGYHNFYTTAWPILSQFGFPVTVFIPTAFIGDSFKNRKCLGWPEVCELHSYGVSFGSHTVSHPQLYGLSWNDIEPELGESKKALEDHLGASVEDFSYPYAYPESDRPFCKRFAAALREYGYARGVTTRLGSCAFGDDVLRLRRLPINDADDLSLFRAKLEVRYDWIGVVQRLVKALKRSTRLGNKFMS